MSQAGKDALEERLSRAVEAYHEAALLYAAVKLGLAERMGARGWQAGELAQALGLFPPHLARFLRGLSLVGICEERADGSFALTPFAQSLTPGSRLAAKVQIVVEQYWQPWANLVSALQSGTPAFAQVFGANIFDWRRDHPEHGALFASYLAKETQAETEAIRAALGASETDKAIEIDGAKAGLLAAIPSGADLYLLRGVLQQYNDADAAVILRNCRKAMPDGARLVVIERLMPERPTDDPAAVMLDLHMMTVTGGRARTLDEFKALLATEGLAFAKVTTTRSGLNIIEAVSHR
jgi:hypothetical protein